MKIFSYISKYLLNKKKGIFIDIQKHLYYAFENIKILFEMYKIFVLDHFNKVVLLRCLRLYKLEIMKQEKYEFVKR